MTEQELQAAKERLKNAAAASPVSVDNDTGKVRMSCLSTTATAAVSVDNDTGKVRMSCLSTSATAAVSVDNDTGKVRMSCLSTTATAASTIHQHCYALHCSETEYVGSPSQRETH